MDRFSVDNQIALGDGVPTQRRPTTIVLGIYHGAFFKQVLMFGLKVQLGKMMRRILYQRFIHFYGIIVLYSFPQILCSNQYTSQC